MLFGFFPSFPLLSISDFAPHAATTVWPRLRRVSRVKFCLGQLIFCCSECTVCVFFLFFFISFQTFSLKIEFRKGVRGHEAAEQPLVKPRVS
jgi:hypothetical protein